MEIIFKDRLPEFYETLAFHYKRGHSALKAVDYLVRSGEKSLARYAVQESHQYFKETFDLLNNKTDRTKDEDCLLIDILIKWSLVYYYIGDSLEQSQLLASYMELAESIDDKARLGMFYAWYGMTIWFREKYDESYKYLHKSLKLGEDIKDNHIIGYACTWLAWTCAELGDLDEAIIYGQRAQDIARNSVTDQYMFYKSLGAIGYASFYKGDRKRTLEAGTELLDYGQKFSNIRCMVMGHFMIAFNYITEGNMPKAIEASKKAVQTTQDPLYWMYSRFLLGISYILNNQFKEAEEVLLETLPQSQKLGCELILTPGNAFLGLITILKGKIDAGLKMMQVSLDLEIANNRKYWYATIANSLGQVYLQGADKGDVMAGKKALEYLTAAQKVGEEMGSKGVNAQIYLNLSHYYQATGENSKESDYFLKALKIFEEYDCFGYLEKYKITSRV